jgi:hypothetical protein
MSLQIHSSLIPTDTNRIRIQMPDGYVVADIYAGNNNQGWYVNFRNSPDGDRWEKDEPIFSGSTPIHSTRNVACCYIEKYGGKVREVKPKKERLQNASDTLKIEADWLPYARMLKLKLTLRRMKE